MGTNAVQGAVMRCTMGLAPSTLSPMPGTVTIEGRPAATVTDVVPMACIKPFGMCTSLSNPAVASATSAAMGVLTPAPCTPIPAGPWKPGAPTTTISGRPALVSGSTCQCAWGGTITLTFTGTVRTTSQ